MLNQVLARKNGHGIELNNTAKLIDGKEKYGKQENNVIEKIAKSETNYRKRLAKIIRQKDAAILDHQLMITDLKMELQEL